MGSDGMAYLGLGRVAPNALEGDLVEGRGLEGPQGRGAQPRDRGHCELRIYGK